jgi:hypothetical protein
MGVGYETFDAEPVGACRALELAQNDRGEGPVKAAIKRRLQLRKASPGQSLAIRAYRAGEQRSSGCRGTAELKETRGRIRRLRQWPPSPRETVIRKSLWPTPTGSARSPKTAMAYEDTTLYSVLETGPCTGHSGPQKTGQSSWDTPRLGHTCKGLGPGSRRDARDARPLRNQSAISYWNAENGGGLLTKHQRSVYITLK